MVDFRETLAPEELMDVESRIKRLETENARLKRAVEELSVLNEVALAVSSASALDQVVALIVQKCVKHLGVEQGAVWLLGAQEADAPLRTMVRKEASDYAGIPYRLGGQIEGWMLKNQKPLVINDLATDGRFRVPAEASNVSSILCVPLRLKGSMIGILSVFNKRGGEEFGESDQRLLTIIAAQSAQVIETVRLLEEEQALARIEQELETARHIQTKLLPKAAPQIAGYDIAAVSKPARQVGGDYYDFLPAKSGRMGLMLADVSGKGISASLLMANIQATIRSLSLADESIGERLDLANRLLHESTDSDKFVTAFHASLDPVEHKLTYSNAGHNPPILIPAEGEPRRLEVGGPVLGVLPSFDFPEATIELAVGDLLLIFTDGFSEAMNLRLDEYGEERLIETAAEVKDRPATEIVDCLFADVLDFAGEAPQADDMTIMVVRRVS